MSKYFWSVRWINAEEPGQFYRNRRSQKLPRKLIDLWQAQPLLFSVFFGSVIFGSELHSDSHRGSNLPAPCMALWLKQPTAVRKEVNIKEN